MGIFPGSAAIEDKELLIIHCSSKIIDSSTGKIWPLSLKILQT